MTAELAKAYDPASVQDEVAKVWDDEKCFHAEPTDPGEPYSIVIPPPNVTAALHLGHALNNTLQDILIRRARMQGKNTVWLPGTDHAGIATQTVVEKRVLKEEGKRRTEFERDDFVKKIQAWKDEYEQVILGQLKAMGCSCDWDRTAFTMDEPRAKAVREAFFQLFKAGLIYRGKRLVNWDPATLTALADDEVENEEVDGFFYYLKYPVVSSTGISPVNHGRDGHATEYITVATTRHETMLGDTAVAINPKDPRAAALKGKFVRLPIVNRIIPIIEDDYVVLPVSLGGDPADTKAQMATGFLKVTPAHDPNDYDIGQRHNLDIINVMAPDASISDKHGWSDIGDAGFLLGQSREEARKLVVKWFKDNALLEDQKPYRHSVGHSYRSHVAIEPYLSDQWYCKVTDKRLAGAALDAMNPSQISRGTGFQPVAEGEQGLKTHATNTGITFYPERYAKTYQTWHENIRDWCISRQLWWGHRIPVWSSSATRIDFVNLPANATVASMESDGMQYICLRENDTDCIANLERAGFSQDPDVLDTWFSSGLWPLSTLGWPLAAEAASPADSASGLATSVAGDASSDPPPNALSTWNPTSVLCTAREIITLWVSRMVMFNQFFQGQIPFKDVFIHAMIQDGDGRKMSKSLGNGVDPLDIISSHGTDAMRFTLTSMATNTQDVRMPVVRDETTGKNTSPKFDLGRNFANKMWNAARFALMQIESNQSQVANSESQFTTLDRWIMSRFNKTVTECDEAISNYRFDQYARACYDFFWRDFCDWYVEIAKVQFKDETKKSTTAQVIATVLDGSLRLMHPMIPFVTEKLWWKLNEVCPDRGIDGWINRGTNSRVRAQVDGDGNSTRIITAQWPIPGQTDDSAEAIVSNLQELIAQIRTARNDYKVSPKQSVTVTIVAPDCGAEQINLHRDMLESLATCKIAGVETAITTPPVNSTKITAGACEIYIEGLVDEAAEQLRNTKRRDELTKAIAAKKGRLANAGYIAKAPPHLVKETQDQLAAEEAELKALSV